MRTLLLVLLCLSVLAPGALARRDRNDGSDRNSRVESRDRSSDDDSGRSSSSHGSSSSSATSSSSPDSTSNSKHSDSGSSSKNSSYHPSESARSTPKEDPPPTIVRSEPPPKPVEETHHSSYKPDPEPAKHTPPPAASALDTAESHGSTATSKAEQRQERIEESRKPNARHDHERKGGRETTVKTTDTGSASHGGYQPGTGSSNGGSSPTGSAGGSGYRPKPQANNNGTVISGSGTTGASGVGTQESGSVTVTVSGQPTTSTNGPIAPKHNYKPDSSTGATAAGNIYKPEQSGKPGGAKAYDHAELNRVGYKPATSAYRVGYRPAKQPTARPKSYKPPTFGEDGRWHYPSTPPFVEDWGRYRPHAYHPRPHFHKPCRYAHWAHDYHPGFSWRSAFFYFAVYPYIETISMRECRYETIEFVYEPIYITGRPYVREPRWERIDEALADIRSAWISERFDLLERHVQPETEIAVLIDGDYDYAISAEDYLAMTEDALTDINTISFVWNKVRERKDGSVMAFADHAYWSEDRARTVYVSYTLKKQGRDYVISEVGSSMNPVSW